MTSATRLLLLSLDAPWWCGYLAMHHCSPGTADLKYMLVPYLLAEVTPLQLCSVLSRRVLLLKP